MKTIQTPQFKILIAEHAGMCFGVKQAIATTEKLLSQNPATILGELAHNPIVKQRLDSKGALQGSLTASEAPSRHVIITAHGASDRDRLRWRDAGYHITDTTCPLVKVAHQKLARLVAKGFHPVIIGKAGHVEVRGLIGDFPGASVVLNQKDLMEIPQKGRIGVVSQTTQPIDKVTSLVAALRRERPDAEIVFQDTVCHPTKDRQKALDELCQASELVLAIGGNHSNNTAQLARTALNHGCIAHHIEGPESIKPEWFQEISTVGVTAGTSTLDESISKVVKRLKEIATYHRKALTTS